MFFKKIIFGLFVLLFLGNAFAFSILAPTTNLIITKNKNFSKFSEEKKLVLPVTRVSLYFFTYVDENNHDQIEMVLKSSPKVASRFVHPEREGLLNKVADSFVVGAKLEDLIETNGQEYLLGNFNIYKIDKEDEAEFYHDYDLGCNAYITDTIQLTIDGETVTNLRLNLDGEHYVIGSNEVIYIGCGKYFGFYVNGQYNNEFDDYQHLLHIFVLEKGFSKRFVVPVYFDRRPRTSIVIKNYPIFE